MSRFRLLIPMLALLVASLACSMSGKESSNTPRATATTSIIQITPSPTTSAPTATATRMAAATAASVNTSSNNVANPAPCSPPSGWVTYRVANGDTLSGIAQRIGTTSSALATANCLSNSDRIDVGQTLYLPSLPPVASNPTGYTGQPAQNCPASILVVGGQGQPLRDAANYMYTGPSTQMTYLGEVPLGTVFTVDAGPVCANNVNWYQVSYNAISGWIMEEEGENFLVEAVIPGQNCPPPILTLGGQGEPLPNAENHMYTGPSATGPWAYLGEVPMGTVFTVVDGPTCAENAIWWQVSYNAITGWIMETQNGAVVVKRYP